MFWKGKRDYSHLIPYIPCAVFLIVFIYFATHLIADFSHDGVAYSQTIEAGKLWGIFHAHHLLYNYFKWLLWAGLDAAGVHARALYVGQIYNAFFGALTAALFYIMAKRFTGRISVSLFGVGALVSVFGFWYCSTFSGVRIAHIAGMIALFISLSYFVRWKEERLFYNILFAVLLGLVHAAIIMFHQSHFLAVFIVLAGILIKQTTLKKKLLYFLVYAAVLFLVSGALYIYVASTVYGVKDVKGFIYWFKCYANMGIWGKYTGNSALHTFSGMRQHLVGFMEGTGKALLGLKSAVFLKILFWFTTGVFVYLFVYIKSIFRRNPAEIILSFAWLLVYVPFFMWWEPYNFEFWIFPLVPFVLLISFALADLLERLKDRRLKGAVWGFFLSVLALYWAYNYFGSIAPRCNKYRSAYYLTILNLESVSPDDGNLVVIVGEEGELDHNIMYFTKKKTHIFYFDLEKSKGSDEAALKLLAIAVKASDEGGKKVFVEKGFLDKEKLDFLKTRFPNMKKETVESFFKENYNMIPAKDKAGSWFFYELKGK